MYNIMYYRRVSSVHVQAACEELMERLEPFVKEDPAAGWEAWVRYEGSLQCCWTTKLYSV